MGRNLQFIFIILFILTGCKENDSLSQKMYNYCLEQNGTIEKITQNDQVVEYCNTIQTGIFDEGTIDYTIECTLVDFYNNRCEEEEEVQETLLMHQSFEKETNDISLSHRYFEKIDEILSNLSNTGYTHRPFSLVPTAPYPEINDTTSPYNLFLDCSGFAGYYILQNVTPKLYEKFDRQYSCGPLQKEDNVTTHIARPLAADFVDKILDKKTPSVNDENISIATIETDSSNQCWGRVDHIRDAKPGDIIAYVHEGNIDTKTLYCCKKEPYDDNQSRYRYTSDTQISPQYSAEKCIEEDNGRIIYKTYKNKDGAHLSTGHVMFIASTPYQCKSLWCEERVEKEWVVRVADSTNVKHSYDTRKVGEDNSHYDGHLYHAWTAGTLERCDDNQSYHRDCSAHGSLNALETIDINGSSKADHPTGIGAGYIFIKDTMDAHRPKYSASMTSGKIAIGRPIECK